MPLYEYKCDKCNAVFEVIQKFSDTPLETHEGCGGHVERLISSPALQFKGSGWYITDYAKGSSSGSNGTSKSAESKSESSKSDSSSSSSSSSNKSE
jgi:putative FmdB family regulatory protein